LEISLRTAGLAMSNFTEIISSYLGLDMGSALTLSRSLYQLNSMIEQQYAAHKSSKQKKPFNILVNGAPGSGKTELIAVIRAAFERLGIKVAVVDTVDLGMSAEVSFESFALGNPEAKVIIFEAVNRLPSDKSNIDLFVTLEASLGARLRAIEKREAKKRGEKNISWEYVQLVASGEFSPRYNDKGPDITINTTPIRENGDHTADIITLLGLDSITAKIAAALNFTEIGTVSAINTAA